MQDREVVELRYQVSYCIADGVADGVKEELHEVHGDLNLTEADDDEAHPGLGMTLLPLECRSDR